MKLATKYSSTASTGRAKRRSANRPRSSSGRGVRRSRHTKAAAESRESAAKTARLDALREAIPASSSMRQTRAAARVAAPAQSIAPPPPRPPRGALCAPPLSAAPGSRSTARAPTTRTAPIGRLMKKMDRQPRLSTRNPPRIGPRMLPTATVEPR